MLALRNGLVPVAAYCPGLRQFVQDFDPVTGTGNGFVFYRNTVAALGDAIGRAAGAGEALSLAARSADYSWAASASQHEALYRRLTVSGR